MSTGWFLTLCSVRLLIRCFSLLTAAPPIPYMNNITCQINLSHWWPGLYELSAHYSCAYLQACYYFQYWLLYKKAWIGHAVGSISLQAVTWQMIYDRELSISLFFFFFFGSVCVTEEERGREREAMRSLPTQVFLLFLFPFVWHLSLLLWDQMVLYFSYTVCHFLLHTAKKNPTYAQLRLASPPAN